VAIEFEFSDANELERPPDPQEKEASAALSSFFEANRAAVFFSRQLEVRNEDKWYHWITNRALRALVKRGVIRSETRKLKTGGTLNLMWHRSYRYYRRDAARVVGLVEEYADPNIGGAVGLNGELMVLEGFARRQFVMRGRNTRSFGETVGAIQNTSLILFSSGTRSCTESK
jgi:hypothetical protein